MRARCAVGLMGVKTGKLGKMLEAFRADNTSSKLRPGSFKTSPTARNLRIGGGYMLFKLSNFSNINP